MNEARTRPLVGRKQQRIEVDRLERVEELGEPRLVGRAPARRLLLRHPQVGARPVVGSRNGIEIRARRGSSAPRPGPGRSRGRCPSGARSPSASSPAAAARRSRRSRRRSCPASRRADGASGTRATARPRPRGRRTCRSRGAPRAAHRGVGHPPAATTRARLRKNRDSRRSRRRAPSSRAASSIARRTASGLSSQGSDSPSPDIRGCLSATMTTRGASSAKRSRTMNASSWRASESRADAAQSIACMSSPVWYGREPATSEPEPRRRLRIVPNERPTSRPRGTSGNVMPAGRRRLRPFEQRILFGAGDRRAGEALAAEVLDRLRPARRPGPGEKPGTEDDPVRDTERTAARCRTARRSRARGERPRTRRALEARLPRTEAPIDNRRATASRARVDDPAPQTSSI